MSAEAAIAYDFALLIITATILSFIAKKTDQPSIVAYIFTGLLLGPVFLNLVTESHLIELMSELGLAFLLFLLGIEMNLGEIKEILRPVTNIAVWQTVLQTSLAFIIPIFLGFTMMETVVIALCTVFGATPVIVKLLTDKNEITTLPGKIDVGVLILQDIYLVIILALFSADSLSNPGEIGFTLTKIFLLMAGVASLSLLSSRYFLPTMFNKVANDKHAFFIHGVAWAFLFTALTIKLDLSVEVGAFLAGLGLGQVTYREELKERIRPITDFFIVVFFSSIGLQLTSENLFIYWKEAVIASAVLMVGNFLIMFYLIDRQNFTPKTSFLGSINMTQVSEFSLVVGALAVSQGYVGNDILGYLSLMALLTMTVSSYLINYNHEIYLKVEHLLERFKSDEKSDVDIKKFDNHAVVIGYNETVRDLLPTLKENYEDIIVIDKNPDNVEELSNEDLEYIYGDFRHSEIRKSGSFDTAELVLSVEKDIMRQHQILRETEEETVTFLSTDSFEKAAELYERGADYVIMENKIAGEEVAELLKEFAEGNKLFDEKIEENLERIYWRDRQDG